MEAINDGTRAQVVS